MTPSEYKELMAQFHSFYESFCNVKEGDRFRLVNDLYGVRGYYAKTRPWTNQGDPDPVPCFKKGEKGTVLTVTVSGLICKLEIKFDEGRTVWVDVKQVGELCILDQLSEI